VRALGNHVANRFDLAGVNYARHALGLPPQSVFG
jgi:hypothetical protein